MADETPPLSYFRAYFAKDLAKEIDKLAAEAMFDRALAAHDAEVRASVVAEEPEWEYGYELIESDTRDVYTRSGAFASEEAARHWARKAHGDESNPEYPPLDVLIVRRRKAGPWLPVEQGDDQTTSHEIRCDCCGDALPSVPSRAHIPTRRDLQRLGFDASKVVCPDCAKRAAEELP